MAILKPFRKALQHDEKSFTTANLCQNHQNRDTFSAKPRRDLRKTRLPPAPNARLERRREIGAIQAKMAHPQNNWKPRLKEEYLIVRLKARMDGQSSISAKNIANLRLRCAFIGK